MCVKSRISPVLCCKLQRQITETGENMLFAKSTTETILRVTNYGLVSLQCTS